MHVLREPFQIDSRSYAMDAGAVRFDGCHLSDIIKYMSNAKYAARNSEGREAGFLAGFLIERALVEHAVATELDGSRAALCKIGELIWCVECEEVFTDPRHVIKRKHRGIALTPDPVNIKAWMLEEWKCTKYSLRSAGADAVWNDKDRSEEPERREYNHIAEEFWEWMVQIKAYCYAIGALYGRPMLGAVLRALFVNGDYGLTTRDYSTQKYWFTFNERELQENWDALLLQAEDGGLLRVVS